MNLNYPSFFGNNVKDTLSLNILRAQYWALMISNSVPKLVSLSPKNPWSSSSYLCLELEVRLGPLWVHRVITQSGAASGEWLGELLKWPGNPGGWHNHVQQRQRHDLKQDLSNQNHFCADYEKLACNHWDFCKNTCV